EKFDAYAKRVAEELLDAGVRVETNLSDDRVGYKIRDASLKKVPYVVVVGEKEQSSDHQRASPRRWVAAGDDGARAVGHGELRAAAALPARGRRRVRRRAAPSRCAGPVESAVSWSPTWGPGRGSFFWVRSCAGLAQGAR